MADPPSSHNRGFVSRRRQAANQFDHLRGLTSGGPFVGTAQSAEPSFLTILRYAPKVCYVSLLDA